MLTPLVLRDTFGSRTAPPQLRRTHAADRGDHFVVNGQKAWCTGGGLPDTTIATYVRTGPREPKHGGISLLLIDPATAGVEVRPIPVTVMPATPVPAASATRATT